MGIEEGKRRGAVAWMRLEFWVDAEWKSVVLERWNGPGSRRVCGDRTEPVPDETAVIKYRAERLIGRSIRRFPLKSEQHIFRQN
jgi:hypothetical protein